MSCTEDCTWLDTSQYLRKQPKSAVLVAIAIFYALFAPCAVQAQTAAPRPPYYSNITISEARQQSLVLLVLNSSRSLLDRQSVVKLTDFERKTTVWHTTSEQSETIFYDLAAGRYDLDISAVGYKPQHKQVLISFAQQNLHVEVQLDRDPSAVDLNTSDDVIPKKYRKDTKRAVYALKSGNLSEAEKHLDKVYRFAPDSAQLNFLYGYLFLARNDLDKSESYLSRAAVLDPRREQTLTLLGRVQLRRKQDHEAQTSLEHATAINPHDWIAHNLLAHADLNLKQYQKAREQAQLALKENKTAASDAQIVLGEALIDLHQDDEGLKVLRAYLRDYPNDRDKPQLESWIAQLAAPGPETPTAIPQVAADRVLDASLPELPVTAWGPPGIDEAKPPVATGVACPYDQVIEMSGRRVEQLVEDVSQFTATENLLHEQLDRFGNPTTKENRKFDYLATISESSPGNFMVDENRIIRSPLIDIPDGIVTRGFMSLALIFHPDIRGDFQITCEGLSQREGQATWLIYFRQRDDVPSRFGQYFVGTQPYALKLKGRAWIHANDFEIVRMESELISPVEKLSVQHQIVQYGPVHFQSKNVDLWLPKSVDLYLEINRRRVARRLTRTPSEPLGFQTVSPEVCQKSRAISQTVHHCHGLWCTSVPLNPAA